jgi:hypothetical protein
MAPPTSGVDATPHINSNLLKMLIKLLFRSRFFGTSGKNCIVWSFDSKKMDICTNRALFSASLTEFRAGRDSRCSEINFWTRISALQIPHHLHGGTFAPFWDAYCYHDLTQLSHEAHDGEQASSASSTLTFPSVAIVTGRLWSWPA